MPPVAVIISTRNGQRRIRPVVQAVLQAATAASAKGAFDVRVVVVDNGSTDATASILRALAATDSRLLLISEPKAGLATARNAGVAAVNSASTLMLFTDDDVVVPRNWIEHMSAPLVSDAFDAVAGAVHISPDLVTAALTPFHVELLADTGSGLGDPPRTLIGASMGVHGRVFAAGFRFDEHLGTATLGGGEETLLHRQIVEAGGRAIFVSTAVATHHVDRARLARGAWIDRAATQGRCEAWLTHHWEHRRPTQGEIYSWTRAVARTVVEARRKHAAAVPSESELQRVRRASTGLWWLRHGREERIYRLARYFPVQLR